VVKPISQSYLTKLWNNENYKDYDKHFQTFVNFISKYFTVVSMAIALLAALFWAVDGSASRAWGAFTAVLIIACPCALRLSPFTLSAALGIFDRNKFYVKNTAAIEQMARIDTPCSIKRAQYRRLKQPQFILKVAFQQLTKSY
jgi:Cu+-exporting ATPase